MATTVETIFSMAIKRARELQDFDQGLEPVFTDSLDKLKAQKEFAPPEKWLKTTTSTHGGREMSLEQTLLSVNSHTSVASLQETANKLLVHIRCAEFRASLSR